MLAVLTALFVEEEPTEQPKEPKPAQRGFLGHRVESEVSIFLVCAELRIALSLCQHSLYLPKILQKENK